MWYSKNHTIGYTYPIDSRSKRDKLALFKLKNELDRGICRAHRLSSTHWFDDLPISNLAFNPIIHRDINEAVRQPFIESELETEALELYPNNFVIERVNRW